MNVQSVEIPSKGTLPLAATSFPLTTLGHRSLSLSQHSTVRRGFGIPTTRIQLLYPVRYPHKEEAEEEQIEKLQDDLEPEKESKQLIRKGPEDINSEISEEPPKKKKKAAKLI